MLFPIFQFPNKFNTLTEEKALKPSLPAGIFAVDKFSQISPLFRHSRGKSAGSTVLINKITSAIFAKATKNLSLQWK